MTATLTVAGHPCGCAQPCDGQSCGLSGLVRPRFFCGQLLTDQDLSDLAAWVLDRRRLGRYRDGWGVVCGLDVGVDPSAVATVLVQPGYAVTSCGEDIVVAAATGLDLASCCPDVTSPCATPAGEPPAACVVDVGIAYREVGEDPVLALGTSGCPQAGECEDSRILESFELRCAPVVDGSEPDRPGWRHWSKSYENAVAIMHQAVADGLPGKATGDGLRSWLSDRLRDQPLRHFAFVANWVERGDPPGAERFTELLFWIAQDRILSVLEGACPPGCPGEVVPLARVWLAAEASSGGARLTSSQVVSVKAGHTQVASVTAPRGARYGSPFAVVITPLAGSGPVYAARVETQGQNTIVSIIPAASALSTISLPSVRDSYSAISP